MLAYPRQAILDTLVKPINSGAKLVNSAFLLPGQTGYDADIAQSGVSDFTSGTQAQRTAAALALVKQVTGDNTPSVNIKLLFGQPSNTRRVNEAALVKTEEAKAGFNVDTTPTAGWSGYLDDNSFDAQFFAWCPSSVAQTGTNANFQSDGGNNHIGYKSSAMDAILAKIETETSASKVLTYYNQADKLLIDDAITLGIFQHPAVTAYNKALKNVKPAPLTPNLVWNYWEWKY